ncbi:MAG: hypothetical protein CEN88_437 [Candidatus Berkelbacteria bacterium Licking1014_2]|uniref:YcfA family protein n=1 Tax=Candidatus Berkelbacteria bacterium Licking1014_2 TaxID=2017146 RepID=A0A554LSE1_9BACT|nr:MAG: hypothetical protein CEN88_437 [Candidatus Berkelbacteria bacterium Licking1014_2]
MPKIPVLKSKELVKILKQNGFMEKRQSGSHLTLYRPTDSQIVTVPIHNRTIGKGLTYAILKQVKIDIYNN